MTEPKLLSGWSSRRLKYLATYNDEVLAENTDEEKEIDYVQISGVSLSHGIEEVERVTFGQAPVAARRKIRSGDILISTVRTYLRAIVRIDETYPDLVASTGFCVVRPSDDVDSGFLAWAVKSEPFISEVISRSVGVIYPVINASELVTINVPVPPVDTQRRIARFLDDKTARLNKLIEKKHAILDRLAEKRQAIITHAVTKGLDDLTQKTPLELERILNTKNIEETGRMNLVAQTPENWTKASVGKYCEVQLGKMLQNAPLSERDEIKTYLRAINIGKNGLDISHKFSMWIRPQETDLFRLKKGDILVSEGGDAGRTAVFDADGEYYFQNAINRIRPNYQDKIESIFVYYWFTFLKSSGYVAFICNVATIPHFTAEKVKASPLAFPSLNIQRRIVRFLDKKTAQIDRSTELIVQSVENLVEYRSALITAAVTGQLSELR